MDSPPTPTLPVGTHEVVNQPPPFEDVNLYQIDVALGDAVRREGAGWADERLHVLGARVGSAQAIGWAVDANRYPPVLHTHDRQGRRLDRVDYHPAYYRLMELSIEHGLHALPARERRAGAHVARAALFFLAAQNEFGHLCPISMTASALPVLRHHAELAAEWEPRITSLQYDPSYLPVSRKLGATVGMAMTEKQGGSDVRANTTRAEPMDGGGAYLLTGHKWFCSAPMSDAFLMLAQAPGGLSCFFVPRFLPDGARNPILVQRLKDKLGNRSNASSEIELAGASGWLIGEQGRGVATIIEMVHHTRLDCTLGSAALMRAALVQALHHCRGRVAFGALLSEQPLMQNVLSDLAIESEAATLLAMRLARAFDGAAAQQPDPHERLLQRVATSVAKFWVSKRAIACCAEALECLGGNGYTEDFPLARMYREAPVDSVWEGSGNVICLDVLRALQREPETADTLLSELARARGVDPRLDAFVADLAPDLRAGTPATARRLVERIALAWSGALMVRHAPPFVADAFCASRLSGHWGHQLGTLPAGTQVAAILARALPTLE